MLKRSPVGVLIAGPFHKNQDAELARISRQKRPQSRINPCFFLQTQALFDLHAIAFQLMLRKDPVVVFFNRPPEHSIWLEYTTGSGLLWTQTPDIVCLAPERC